MKKTTLRYLLLSGFVLGAVACEALLPGDLAEADLLDGTVDDLTPEQNARFLAGDRSFREVFTPAMGLGPTFVASSCISCHAGDGKGHPFTTLTRFGHTDSLGKNEFDHGFQLQNRAIPGYEPEQLPANTPHAEFTPPSNTGMGFLELVSEDDILAMAAANVNNQEGVRGHPNWNLLPRFVHPDLKSKSLNNRYICRFGKKAGAYNLFHQTVVAYNQDMGIASSFEPSDVYSLLDINPEVSDKTVRDVVFYLQTLKAPIQRTQENPDVLKGNQLFSQIGCESCHKQTLRTGYSPVAALSNTEFHPFTDLLLHDMGPGLDDGYIEGSAEGSEWRTPPLWGLGLAKNSQGGRVFLLHDGRAHSVDAAIKLHGGEAGRSREKYAKLSDTDRGKLLKFLDSL